jgi:hypothetical protein
LFIMLDSIAIDVVFHVVRKVASYENKNT